MKTPDAPNLLDNAKQKIKRLEVKVKELEEHLRLSGLANIASRFQAEKNLREQAEADKEAMQKAHDIDKKFAELLIIKVDELEEAAQEAKILCDYYESGAAMLDQYTSNGARISGTTFISLLKFVSISLNKALKEDTDDE